MDNNVSIIIKAAPWSVREFTSDEDALKWIAVLLANGVGFTVTYR